MTRADRIRRLADELDTDELIEAALLSYRDAWQDDPNNASYAVIRGHLAAALELAGAPEAEEEGPARVGKHEYRVVTVGSTGSEVIVQPSALHNEPCDRWTHATATEYARVKGPTMRPGVRIVVRRRRGHGAWQAHREYVVGEGGTVRRADRPPSGAPGLHYMRQIKREESDEPPPSGGEVDPIREPWGPAR